MLFALVYITLLAVADRVGVGFLFVGFGAMGAQCTLRWCIAARRNQRRAELSAPSCWLGTSGAAAIVIAIDRQAARREKCVSGYIM